LKQTKGALEYGTEKRWNDPAGAQATVSGTVDLGSRQKKKGSHHLRTIPNLNFAHPLDNMSNMYD